MIPIKNTPPLPDNHRDLVVRFLAELMRATIDVENHDEFRRALQTYCDSLRPWLEPADGPPNPRAVFSLLEDFSFDATCEQASVVLSPEAEALFEAWLRRKKVWGGAGLNTARAWSN